MSEQPRDAWTSTPVIWLRSILPWLVGGVLAFALYRYGMWSESNQGSRLAMPIFHFKILSLIGINAIMAVSLNVVNGYTGQFSLGHVGFMAIGGYVSGALTYYGSMILWQSTAIHGELFGGGDFLFLGALLCGGLVAALAGYVVGLPSLRLRGDYLAIVTLGFGEIVRLILTLTRPIKKTAEEVSQAGLLSITHNANGSWALDGWMISFGGALGFDGIPKYTNLFWIYLLCFATIIFCYRLKQSVLGKAFVSIREDEVAAEAMGVPTTRYKVLAFVIAAFFGGVGGGLFAHEVGILISPPEMNFLKSVDYVIMVVLGGMGSISGAVLAAIALTILPELLRDLSWIPFLPKALHDVSDYRLIIYALILICVMIMRPQGLMGIKEIWEVRPALWLRAKLARKEKSP